MASLENLNISENKKRYIMSTLNPLLEDVVTSCLRNLPDKPANYITLYLIQKFGSDEVDFNRVLDLIPADTIDSHVRARRESESATSDKFESGDGVSASLMDTPGEDFDMSGEHASRIAHLESEVARLSSLLRDQGKITAESLRVVHSGGEGGVNEVDPHSDDESDDDYFDEEAELAVREKSNQLNVAGAPSARHSVSAEVYGQWNPKPDDFVPPVFEKSETQMEEITTILSASFMFSALSKKDLNTVILAMEIENHEGGTRVINEGDDGDFLYVVEQGELECFKKFPVEVGEDADPEFEEKMVKTYSTGEYFGELALLYNCPRAASIQCKTDSILLKLDRGTFNCIVKEAAGKRREHYEKVLQKVPLLQGMDNYERSQVADAIVEEEHSSGDAIVEQGDVGDKIYFVEEGTCVANKNGEEVLSYTEGDYFGELALIRDEPRAATILATSDCKLLSLDRNAFNRLLGSLSETFERASERYN